MSGTSERLSTFPPTAKAGTGFPPINGVMPDPFQSVIPGHRGPIDLTGRLSRFILELKQLLEDQDDEWRFSFDEVAEDCGLRLDYGFVLCDGGQFDEARREQSEPFPEPQGNLFGVYDIETRALAGVVFVAYGREMLGSYPGLPQIEFVRLKAA